MPRNKGKSPQEWVRQAKYDIDTAKAMFRTGRYIYTIFMCHLSIEKLLKGLYAQKLKEPPSKTHNLIYLIEKIGLELPENFYDFIFNLNRVSIPTRYPDNLKRMIKDYNKPTTADILKKSRGILRWLEKKL